MSETTTAVQTCGRRMLDWGPWEMVEGQDTWRTDRSSMVMTEPAEWTKPACSFCGSLHPDVLLKGLRENVLSIGGTDKNYKWYVDLRHADEAKAEADWKQRETDRYVGLGLAATQATAQADQDWANYGRGSSMTTVAKFYTVHLSRAQCEEILAMWTAGTLHHSMYVRPWLPALAEDAPDWLVRP